MSVEVILMKRKTVVGLAGFLGLLLAGTIVLGFQAAASLREYAAETGYARLEIALTGGLTVLGIGTLSVTYSILRTRFLAEQIKRISAESLSKRELADRLNALGTVGEAFYELNRLLQQRTTDLQNKVRQQKNLLQIVFGRVTEEMVVCDVSGRILYRSGSKSKAVPADIESFTTLEIQPSFDEIVATVLRTRSSENVVVEGRRLVMHPVFTNSGGVCYLVFSEKQFSLEAGLPSHRKNRRRTPFSRIFAGRKTSE